DPYACSISCSAAYCCARASSRLAMATTSTSSDARAAGRISSLMRAVERTPRRMLMRALEPSMRPQPLPVADLRLHSFVQRLGIAQDAILLDDDPPCGSQIGRAHV